MEQKGENKMVKYLLFLFALIFIILAILSYFGVLVQEVKTVTYIFGELNKSHNKNEYALWITYFSKGAFIANQNIHVKVRLRNNDNALDGKTFRIIFNSAYPTQFLNRIEEQKFSFIDSMVQFENIKKEELLAETDITYLVPGEHPFSIEIDNNRQKDIFFEDAYFYLGDGYLQAYLPNLAEGEYFMTSRSKIHIAPLEDYLQIQNNNFILTLIFLAVSFTIIQLYLTIYPSEKKDSGKRGN